MTGALVAIKMQVSVQPGLGAALETTRHHRCMRARASGAPVAKRPCPSPPYPARLAFPGPET